jgi:hypothetical protein
MSWPAEPHWGKDARGRFRYTDYDGEQLFIWGEGDGELWIDKRGEGPVYIRPEHAEIIVNAIRERQ